VELIGRKKSIMDILGNKWKKVEEK